MEPLRSSKRLKTWDQRKLTLKADNGHPLLNGLILENIFGYLKGQDNAFTTLAQYRVVCKIWDSELVNFVRKDTQINLCTLLRPYPDGMGWTVDQDNLERTFYYEVPCPEVRLFENVLVVADSCDKLRNKNWINWFQIMGSDVKRLCFSCPLICFCQNQFLELILKEWCPNLEYLELRDIKYVGSLFIESLFLQNEKSLNLNFLKDLKISVDLEKESFSLCPKKLNFDNNAQKMTICARCWFISISSWEIVEIIYDHGLKSSSTIQFEDIANKSVQNKSLPAELIEAINDTDGGIVGQIMKEINLEKLSVDGFNDEQDCDIFAAFLHIRDNKWRSSLKSLELDECLSKLLTRLNVIAQVEFPLSKIKLGGLHFGTNNEDLTRILSCFSNTLEHLEFSGPSVQREILNGAFELILPVMPKLKTFVHENVLDCNFYSDNLWNKAPNLEMCRLKGSLAFHWNADRFFGNATSVSYIALEDLKLSVRISGKQAEMILNRFPNLLRMELVLESLGHSTYVFFGKLEMSKVQRLKIAFIGFFGEHQIFGKGKNAVVWKTANIQGLKSLELNNMSNLPFCMTAKSFFGGNLTSLKLINFRFFGNDEKENLLRGLSHIPSVELVNTVSEPR